MCRCGVIRYYLQFPVAVPERGAGCPRVTQPFATLCTPEGALTVRLACVKRAASVHPEPGSNSPFKNRPPKRSRFPLSRSRPGPQDHADLGFKESTRSVLSYTLRFVFLWSVSRRSHRSQYPVFKVRRVAVSGFQGSPRRSDLRAARGNILGISAPRVAVIPAVHIFCTTAARGTADQLGILCLSHSSALLVLPECLFTNDTRTVNSRELPRHLVVALYRCGGHGRHGLGCLSFRPTAP